MRAERPKAVVEEWVEGFNSSDVERLVSLYAPDAINHQMAEEPVVGSEAIRLMFEREFSNADMTCLVEKIFEDNEWAMLEWTDPLGLRGCGFFHVVDGVIALQRG